MSDPKISDACKEAYLRWVKMHNWGHSPVTDPLMLKAFAAGWQARALAESHRSYKVLGD